eukprot:Em0023g675a
MPEAGYHHRPHVQRSRQILPVQQVRAARSLHGGSTTSTVSADNWSEKPAYNCDHFLYWGAASKYLGEGAKRLRAHPSDQGYLQRASSVRVVSQSSSKTAYQTHPEGAYASSAASSTHTVRSTQLFPNEDFGAGKGQGVSAYICVFDPTLVGEEMTRQRDFLTELLQLISKTKKRIVLVCVKCDAVDEGKRKLGSVLANSILKKPIPYIETSAREGINVDDAFFVAATGSVKKMKGVKAAAVVAGKHSFSSTLTYKEGADAKKQDVNQARDAYRRLLTRKVNHFSCLWSDIVPVLEVEPEYNHLLRIGGDEAREMVKKMFCMRLIELKIKEANEQLKLNTVQKKLDNGRQKAFQSYLSDAFKQHPDMGPDFLTECIPSGRSTPSYAVHTQILENGGTASSTPNQTIGAEGTFYFSPSVSSVNPSPLPLATLESQSGSYAQLQPPSSWSAVSPAASSLSSMVPSGSPLVSSGPHMVPSGSPMVPSGSHMVPTGSSSSSISSMQKRASQQVLTFGSPVLQQRIVSTSIVASPMRQQRGTHAPFQTSVDCLLGPLPPEPEPEPDVRSETASEANTADAQPYLNPRDLGLVPLPSPVAPSPPPRPRGTNQFRSLRMTKHQSRPQLPDKLKAVGSVSRTLSLRGHKRSHSNPGLLEGSVRQAAHTLPAGLHNTTALMVGNGDNFASIAATSSTGNDSIPIQSSSDFAHSEFQRVAPTDSNDDTGDGGANCTGPTGDDRGNVNDQSSDDEDNQSELSGPFEEIDERPPVQGGGGSSGILPLESPAINVPNHYAMIEDYVAMRSAEPVVEGGVEPAPQQSNGEEDTDARRSTFSPFSLVKRQFTKTKKSSAGEASPPTPPQGKQTSPSTKPRCRDCRRPRSLWSPPPFGPSHPPQKSKCTVVPTEDMAAFPPPFFQAPPLSAQGSDDTMQGGVPLQAETRSVAKTTLTSDLPTPAEEPEEEREPEPGHLDMIESMVRSRDDMIGFINQQLNQSFQSDSDDDQSDEREEEGTCPEIPKRAVDCHKCRRSKRKLSWALAGALTLTS